jgi:Kef-type K+ transport system membrane component KefB
MALTTHPVSTIDSHQLLVFLLQCGLLLLLTVLLGRLAARFRMPPLVGELLAGVALGPPLLSAAAPGLANWLVPQRPDQFHLLDAVGQISVLLLVGITGMQLDLGLVRRRGATAVRVSIAGLTVPLALGVGCGFLLPASLMAEHGDRTVFALFLGVALSVSAIPVIAKTLMDLDLLHRNVGQLTLAAGMVDDALGWLMLSVVAAMATIGLRGGAIALSVLSLIAVLAAAAILGRPLVRTVVRVAGRSSEPGPIVAVCVVMMLLGAAATQALGFEAILGAFICGVLIGSSGALDHARLASLRSVVTAVLAPLFFATAGLRMDITALGRPSVLLAAMVVLLVAIAGKFTGAFVGALASRMNRWEAVALGAGMNARGIIEVVVAGVGLRLGVLTTESYTVVILVAIVTSLMAGPILRWSMAHVTYTDEERFRAVAYALHPTGTTPTTDANPGR